MGQNIDDWFDMIWSMIWYDIEVHSLFSSEQICGTSIYTEHDGVLTHDWVLTTTCVSAPTTQTCSATVNDKTTAFLCNISLTTTPSSMWTCRRYAYHVLPSLWHGCCYLAMVVPSFHLIVPKTASTPHPVRSKHSVQAVPTWYQGYHLWDPWTGPGASTDWSLLPGGSTAALFNIINGLAWQVLAIANDTEEALELVNMVFWQAVFQV